jgi:hypothetical protein
MELDLPSVYGSLWHCATYYALETGYTSDGTQPSSAVVWSASWLL